MDNKKNTILLTVIAVATLLVAVVGATFAFFTAQGGDAQKADVTVVTGTAASASLGSWSAISIYADATTFASGLGDKTGTSEGTVTWTAPGKPAGSSTEVAESDRTYCYNATLNITANTFEARENGAELVFNAQKGNEVVIENMDITTTTTDVKIPTAKNGTDYKHTLVADAGQKVSDSWKLTVTLKNLDVDQNYNTNKTFNGAVKFVTVDCTTGEPKTSE